MVYKIVHYDRDVPVTLTPHQDLADFGRDALLQRGAEKLVVVDTLTNTVVAALSYFVVEIQEKYLATRRWIEVDFLGTTFERDDSVTVECVEKELWGGNCGLGTALLRHLRYVLAEAGETTLKHIAMTDSIPFFRRFGFNLLRLGASEGGELWGAETMKYDLRRRGPSKSLLLEVMRVIRRVTIQ